MEKIKDIPVKGFIETSFVDWPGKICSVIFFSRCNFRCPYCHNADLVMRPDALQDVAWEDIASHLISQKGWIDGVCVSGGEPTLHPSLPDVFRFLKKQGFLTKIDTNGSNPTILKTLIEEDLLDYVAMDVKSCLDEQSYCKITGTAHMIDTVKESIDLLLSSRAVQHEFRVTVVPTYHGPEEIYKLARDLNGAQKLRVQNFSPSSALLDPSLQDLKPFSEEEIGVFQDQVDRLIGLQP